MHKGPLQRDVRRCCFVSFPLEFWMVLHQPFQTATQEFGRVIGTFLFYDSVPPQRRPIITMDCCHGRTVANSNHTHVSGTMYLFTLVKCFENYVRFHRPTAGRPVAKAIMLLSVTLDTAGNSKHMATFISHSYVEDFPSICTNDNSNATQSIIGVFVPAFTPTPVNDYCYCRNPLIIVVPLYFSSAPASASPLLECRATNTFLFFVTKSSLPHSRYPKCTHYLI